jgi:hypothetical protein
MEERKGGLDIPITDGARVGGRGIGLNWETMGKKKGEERWTG